MMTQMVQMTTTAMDHLALEIRARIRALQAIITTVTEMVEATAARMQGVCVLTMLVVVTQVTLV